MTQAEPTITPVKSKRDFKAFIDCAYRLNAHDPNWVPPLRAEVKEILTLGKNPFHDHADMQLFLARRGDEVVGRISAHIDHLALDQPVEQGMGPGTGYWGMFEAVDETVARALIATAEDWLRGMKMTQVRAPISLSMWEEPGLLVKGHDHPPTVMMGHNSPLYQGWIEAAGYTKAKSLLTYELDITKEFPPLIQRIVASGERNSRIRVRQVELKEFKREAGIVINLVNDAWSKNWGFVPFTEREAKYAGKKMKPLIREDLNMIAELDGEPVAFMLTWSNINEVIAGFEGKLLPFKWIKLLKWLRNPHTDTMRVPLMGVRSDLQNSRMASQLAFMMIEFIRRQAVAHYGATRGEIGWVLEDNQGMVAIADAIQSKVNREYRIYGKPL
ncbi:hypothetical protein NT2_05_01680 [Caenibius tardaugens NBRC 16725]|uniref:N-acetyltransferase domain-containing protein n=1 Tax=Caenibius tardaugens NBRC 16725 TaxID=1219035 RepID=U3A3B8_9SPHN|nr:hypothetical protein [Caenibius tardaugens]AZI36597.1 N-acetyltransferase [Caenibius tardaugens NBRC 16725]GAD49248.1 hypothetical protein NT2_05_01680 [Caenibius tardaugens NBRC 16725]